jgi:hypothetical protein
MTDLADPAPVLWYVVPPLEVARPSRWTSTRVWSSREAVRRRGRDDPNRLPELPRELPWRAFLRQFRNLMIVIPLVAAAVRLGAVPVARVADAVRGRICPSVRPTRGRSGRAVTSAKASEADNGVPGPEEGVAEVEL